jgi:hypothetical protein
MEGLNIPQASSIVNPASSTGRASMSRQLFEMLRKTNRHC